MFFLQSDARFFDSEKVPTFGEGSFLLDSVRSLSLLTNRLSPISLLSLFGFAEKRWIGDDSFEKLVRRNLLKEGIALLAKIPIIAFRSSSEALDVCAGADTSGANRECHCALWIGVCFFLRKQRARNPFSKQKKTKKNRNFF